MNLTKLLRKYSKPLLMIFMALLLVVFLIPDTLQGCGARDLVRNLTLGEAYGREITDAERERASQELSILGRFGLSIPLSPDSDSHALDYYLLTQEAQAAGLHVSNEEVIAQLRRGGLTDEMLQRLVPLAPGRSYDDIYATIGRGLAVLRLLSLQNTANFESLPRKERMYRDTTQQAVADLSLINSRAFLHLVPEPTEEQLVAFFEECKGRNEGHTDEELVFGYKLPDRVQVEYLTCDPEAVAQSIMVREDDVRDFYEDHKPRYTRPVPPAQPNDPPASVQMTFEEAETLARQDLRRVRAREIAQSVINDIFTVAQQPWVTTGEREDGFMPTPAGELVSFEDLAARYSQPDRPVTYHRTALVDIDGLRLVAGLGQAYLAELPAADLAFRVKGIFTPQIAERLPVLNVMEPAPVVLTRDYDPRSQQNIPRQAYVFRVVQVVPAAPPDSLEAVRSQLIRDWKLVQAHALAKDAADKLAAQARAVGLTAAVEGDTDLKATLLAGEQAVKAAPDAPPTPPDYIDKLKPVTPERLTRMSSSARPLDTGPNVAPAIFELSDMPVNEQQPHRVAVIPNATRFAWVVGELKEVKPLYEGSFGQWLSFMIRSSDWQAPVFIQQWTASENVSLRTGFKPALEAAPPDKPE